MLTRERILHLLNRLNELLAAKGDVGEIGLVGGAVMCLVYNARASTRDVDGVFAPTKTIRELAAKIADEEDLPSDWLNDGAKSFIPPQILKDDSGRQDVLLLSHLRVWAPDPRYMLVMKCLSARWDSSDRADVIFLIRHLKFKSSKSVLNLIEKYYPKNRVPAKTSFFIEEIFEKKIKN